MTRRTSSTSSSRNRRIVASVVFLLGLAVLLGALQYVLYPRLDRDELWSDYQALPPARWTSCFSGRLWFTRTSIRPSSGRPRACVLTICRARSRACTPHAPTCEKRCVTRGQRSWSWSCICSVREPAATGEPEEVQLHGDAARPAQAAGGHGGDARARMEPLPRPPRTVPLALGRGRQGRFQPQQVES